jgi:hypothetical protein
MSHLILTVRRFPKTMPCTDRMIDTFHGLLFCSWHPICYIPDLCAYRTSDTKPEPSVLQNLLIDVATDLRLLYTNRWHASGSVQCEFVLSKAFSFPFFLCALASLKVHSSCVQSCMWAT